MTKEKRKKVGEVGWDGHTMHKHEYTDDKMIPVTQCIPDHKTAHDQSGFSVMALPAETLCGSKSE